MGLKDILSPGLVHIDSTSRDKKSVLMGIADLAAGQLTDNNVSTDLIYKALSERESLGSTGFGHGVALPHCRIPQLDSFLVGMILTSSGIDFESVDGEDARIFPFVIGPESRPKEHLKLLSVISQILRDSDFRKQLSEVRDDQALYELMCNRILPDSGELARRPGSKLVFVFVQNEKLFDDILQVFAAAENTSAMVIEAHESTDYLSKIPLFAGFWNSELHQFNRIITAVVRDELSNAFIRNIEYVCGKLSDRDDVMVAVSDLHYVLGSLGN